MSSDLELLQMAAKAAEVYSGFINEYGGGKTFCWNPLLDEGDLYRLMKACKLSVDFEDCTVWRRMTNHHLIQEFWGGENGEEAHAIVRAAADIGRAMP